MASQPRNVIVRSPAGLLASSALADNDPMSRSPSAISTGSTSSPMIRPGLLRRRSTETSGSGGLDYYWSSLAGAGPNSSSSSLAGVLGQSASSSSLAISPSPSQTALGTSPAAHKSRSTTNLRGRYDSDLTIPPVPSTHSLPGPSRTAHINGQARGLGVGDMGSEPESPGWSEGSDYSSTEAASVPRADRFGSGTAQSGHEPIHVWPTSTGEGRRPLVDPPSTRSHDVRDSMVSASTYKPDREDEHLAERTPMAPVFRERDLATPSAPLNYDRSPRHEYPSRMPAPTKQTTPTLSSPSASTYTPGSGRLPFVPSLESPNPGYLVDVRVTSPKSAPSWKTEFGELREGQEDEGEITIKGRNRQTLPASASVTSAISGDGLLSPEKDMLSPTKRNGATTPQRRGSAAREASPSPSIRSPELPPRSSLRGQLTPRLDSSGQLSNNASPRPSVDLPRIINTAHSPEMASGSSSRTDPPRPSRSPSRSPSITNSTTLNDLTEMLGGAIDAIGLIDSRDTPPPNIMAPRKESQEVLAPAADVSSSNDHTRMPISDSGTSLQHGEPGAMLPPPLPPRDDGAKQHAMSALGSGAPPVMAQSPTSMTMNIAARPWPAAMLYGNIKGMRYAGDRAKGYAKAINELARAETGLREWCVASAAQANKPTAPPQPKSIAMASLGNRTSSYSTTSLAVPSNHMRNVSSSSEFPMRADSYTAREISQRVIDPTDAPGSLPSNLPYPQLQQQYQSGGMKSSQSMQSVASFASGKKGFFSGIGKRSSGKKESGLGPPTGAAGKKDVRGLSISNPTAPRSGSPQRVSDMGGKNPLSAPLGPRNPRLGSFTPPPAEARRGSTEIPSRSSLDTGLSRMNGSVPGPRGSFDGMRRKGSLPPKATLMSIPALGRAEVSEEQVKSMGDVLPHVSKGVIRAYLARYEDQMQAIGMYLEDENKGTVMRAA